MDELVRSTVDKPVHLCSLSHKGLNVFLLPEENPFSSVSDLEAAGE